jgi:putative aminopeptidase FrvX
VTAIPETLRGLLEAPGPSGREEAAAAAFRAAAGEFAELASDTLGSTVARVRGTAGGPLLAVIGHIDEIGVIVTHVDDRGFVRFDQVGGWDPIVLVGQRVALLGREGPLTGVIARKPIHLLDSDARKQAPQLKDLHIDLGARDGEDARRLVREGDVGVIAADPVALPNGRVAGRALDNRLGCYIALEAARLVAEGGGAPGDVAAVAAVQEEILPRVGGATALAYGLRPDVALVVDVSFETGQPGVDPGEIPKAEFGDGPTIVRGSILHPAVADALVAAAEAEGIPHRLGAEGRSTGTDADAVYLTREGIPTGLLGVPTRYLHSPVEMVQLSDVEACARLIAAFARRLEPGMTWTR